MLIPTLFVRDIAEAVAFYTEILDFRLHSAMPETNPFYAVLTRGADEMHLSLPPTPGRRGAGCAIVVCDDVDTLFARFREHGLSVPTKADSPVHAAPVDQSWGPREFYVDDANGNTIVFQQR